MCGYRCASACRATRATRSPPFSARMPGQARLRLRRRHRRVLRRRDGLGLGTRFQADRDLIVGSGFRCVPLDPSLGGARIGAKPGFDCTIPFGQGATLGFTVPLPPSFRRAHAGPWRRRWRRGRRPFSTSWRRRVRATAAMSCSHRAVLCRGPAATPR